MHLLYVLLVLVVSVAAAPTKASTETSTPDFTAAPVENNNSTSYPPRKTGRFIQKYISTGGLPFRAYGPYGAYAPYANYGRSPFRYGPYGYGSHGYGPNGYGLNGYGLNGYGPHGYGPYGFFR